MLRNLFTHPPRLPLVAPSILAADFANMATDCRSVLPPAPPNPAPIRVVSKPPRPLPGHGDLLHVDVMDGHFVPNLTFGPDMVKGLRRAIPEAFLDVHLMVTDPWLHAQAFVKAGADHITFHVEVVPPAEIAGLARRIRELESPQGAVSVGLAINPPTPVEKIMPHLETFELILAMSVNPGFGGQSFMPEVLDKVRTISEELTPHQRLEMDGGIGEATYAACLDAGCDVLVAGNAVFSKPVPQRPQVIAKLRGRSENEAPATR